MKTDTKFTARTHSVYRHMSDRAGGVLPFDLAELRALVRSVLDSRPICPYCNALLTGESWSADHKVPVSRGGSWHLSNVQIVCKNDNKSKGDMSDVEYRNLLRKLDELEHETRNVTIKSRVLTALRISQSFRQGAMRRAKR